MFLWHLTEILNLHILSFHRLYLAYRMKIICKEDISVNTLDWESNKQQDGSICGVYVLMVRSRILYLKSFLFFTFCEISICRDNCIVTFYVVFFCIISNFQIYFDDKLNVFAQQFYFLWSELIMIN